MRPPLQETCYISAVDTRVSFVYVYAELATKATTYTVQTYQLETSGGGNYFSSEHLNTQLQSHAHIP